MSDAPALLITDLRKKYPKGTEALKCVSLTVPKGEFFALLGPNGAGKTTLIGITAGLTVKTGGTVSVMGYDIDAHAEEAKSAIGLVPQEFNFSIFEKVEDIILDQAGFYGIPREEARRRAEPILKNLGLWEKRRDQAQKLSGGMKRRLMIARALIHEPKVLLLDEPTAGVDVELRRGMWEYLREIAAKGTTIILTTHYLEEAEQLAKHVAVINKGQIVVDEPMQDLLGRHGGKKLEDIFLELIKEEKVKES